MKLMEYDAMKAADSQWPYTMPAISSREVFEISTNSDTALCVKLRTSAMIRFKKQAGMSSWVLVGPDGETWNRITVAPDRPPFAILPETVFTLHIDGRGAPSAIGMTPIGRTITIGPLKEGEEVVIDLDKEG